MKGYVSEIFSSFQGEGKYVGRRQVFIRFSGCNLHCSYCDTPESRIPREFLRIETYPGSSRFFERRNPIDSDDVVKAVKTLKTSDLHSVSFTGGEPLLGGDFVTEVAEKCIDAGFHNYLETNGYSSKRFGEVIDFFDYAAIDVKLPNHRAIEEKEYETLYRNEIECVGISVEKGVDTMVKAVILPRTELDWIKRICEDLSGLKIGFVIQPVTSPKKVDPSELFRISETVGEFFKDVFVIPQV
ncbi:MAG: 7-carboxy-7-deazaguanine synthase QueE, partial [Candidatus Syntropharchaeia archaeon]